MATEEQTQHDSTKPVGLSWNKRVGQRLTITDRIVSKLSLCLLRYPGATGDVTFTIRKVSDDSIMASKVWGDASSIPQTATWCEATFDTPVAVNEEVRIQAEYNGATYISFHYKNSDVKGSEVMTYYDTSNHDDTGRDAAYIYTYTPAGEVVAGFSAEPTEGKAPIQVQFTDATIGGTPPYAYTWDFGDDTPVSHEVNPSHTYEQAGYYTVTLTVTDSDSPPDEDVEEKVNYIFVSPPEVLIELSPSDKTPTATEEWADVECDGLIGADSTGVLLHIINPSGTEYEWGIRKKGSTDDIKGKIAAYAQTWAFIGVDTNRKFQAYIENTNLRIYVVGYTLYGVAFLDNAVDKTPGSLGWQDIDCDAQVEHDPVGLIFLVKNITADALRSYGIRKNGSTDEYTEGHAGYLNIAAGNMHFLMIGCDGGHISEFQLSGVGDVKLYLIGYIFGGMTFLTNAHDKSLSTPYGEYQDVDISAQAETAAWGIMQVNCNDKGGRYASMRYPGTSIDEYHQVTYGAWKPQHTNTSQVFEAKIQDGDVDFWLVGYVHETELQPLTISGRVKVGAAAVEGAHVICYNLTKSAFVEKALTDENGDYTFLNAGYEFETFLVAAHYDDGVNYYGLCKKVQLEEE